MYRDVEVAELLFRLDADETLVVLDVREPEEFAHWSIPHAINIPLGELAKRAGELPTDREVVTVCGMGNRSAKAAELLASTGHRVANLTGGMEAWASAYDSVTLELGDLRVVQVRRRGKGCLSYLIGAGDEAFVVDPSADLDQYCRLADEHGWTITRIFETHLHADHLSGARALAAQIGASLHLNHADPFAFASEALHDGERFFLSGRHELAVTALFTPGHTPGSTVYVVADQVVLSGDVLFVDSVGRPDLADRAEEFAHELYRSLHDRLLSFSEETLVLPAHYGDAVTVRSDLPVGALLGALLRSLGPLFLDEQSFVAWAASAASERPPNYNQIIEFNMGRTRSTALDTLRSLELGPNRCAVAV